MNLHVRHLLTGIPLYAIGSLVGQVLYGLAIYNENIIALSTLATLFFFSFLAGKDLEARSAIGIIQYSIIWALLAVGLDSIIVVPVLGWEYLSALDVLVSYAIIAVAPLVSFFIEARTSSRISALTS